MSLYRRIKNSFFIETLKIIIATNNQRGSKKQNALRPYYIFDTSKNNIRKVA
jgi:hypothetical protein